MANDDDPQTETGDTGSEPDQRPVGAAGDDDQQAAEAEREQRSGQEPSEDLKAGAVEPGGMTPTAADTDKSPEELEREIDEVRGQLGDTVEQLAAKADVPSRVSAEAERRKEQAQRTVSDIRTRISDADADDARQAAQQAVDQAKQNPAVPAAIAAAVVLVAFVIWRRRR